MRRFLKWLSYIILGLAVVFFVFALLMPVVFSGKLAIVRSSSMEPAMPAGALAMMVPVDPEKVEVGDIITFDPPWDPDVTVSHRVIDIRSDGQLLFDTKGDAMEESDPFFVSAEMVQGKVVFNIPYLGFAANYALNYIQTWWGLILLVVLPSLVIVSGVVRSIYRPPNRRQKRLDLLRKRQRRWKG